MKKILIVEDDADTVEIIDFVLEDLGYEVININRKISVQEIAELNPRLILLDYLTPFGLGSELCLALKADGLTKHIPVIFCSAYGHLDKIARESCADGYLAKPFELTDLESTVNTFAL